MQMRSIMLKTINEELKGENKQHGIIVVIVLFVTQSDTVNTIQPTPTVSDNNI